MRFLLITLTLLVAGCGSSGPPRIDGTNNETFKATLDELQQDFTEEERKQFSKELTDWVMAQALVASMAGNDSDGFMLDLRQRLDGKTLAEVRSLIEN